MAYCWYTSFMGYPNFIKASGNAADLGKFYIKIANAALNGMSYKQSKSLFSTIDIHQVETKKAAMQEFGLLYVKPRTNTITITPLGLNILSLCKDRNSIDSNKRVILLSLANGLAKYQFNNPLPVGGNRRTSLTRASSSDVLPYLVCYYLLHKLGGFITESEIRGAIFAIDKMSDLPDLVKRIKLQRKSGIPFNDIASLPPIKKTADNLRIYFVSHLSLDNEILCTIDTEDKDIYNGKDRVYELNQLGYEITESILETEWNKWKEERMPTPKARIYSSIDDYFSNGVGQASSSVLVHICENKLKKEQTQYANDGVSGEDLENIKTVPRRKYIEAKRKFVNHVKIEKTRNPSLVKDAKKDFKNRHGKLYCNVCAFNYETKYGKRGKNFIEAHHKKPISELKGNEMLVIEDILLVCANCHRMLHRAPWITGERLKILIDEQKKLRSGSI